MKIFPVLKHRQSAFTAAALVSVLLGGCNRTQVTAPAAPVVVAPATPAPVVDEIYVESAPPPPPTEVMVVSPGPDHVWVGGYWGRTGRERVWVRGRWERPPQPRAVWVQPRWEHRSRGYVFVQGYWR